MALVEEVGWEKREGKGKGKGRRAVVLLLWEKGFGGRLINLLFPVTHALSGKVPRPVDLFEGTKVYGWV